MPFPIERPPPRTTGRTGGRERARHRSQRSRIVRVDLEGAMDGLEAFGVAAHPDERQSELAPGADRVRLQLDRLAQARLGPRPEIGHSQVVGFRDVRDAELEVRPRVPWIEAAASLLLGIVVWKTRKSGRPAVATAA